MAPVERVWHKLYSRRQWGRRGTQNRRMRLLATSIPLWWVLYTGCQDFGRFWTWRDQLPEERGE